ncbi:MAG: ribonuclease P subunit p25 family protein [Candidatus Lokiarchaeota archaeon]|nr:ribonuclease P subunit p25 family protein [Candidatus Lokiarchaeota archaeon]
MGERGRDGGRDRDRRDGRQRGERGRPKDDAGGRRERGSAGPARRSRRDPGFGELRRRFEPRMEQRGDGFYVFVSAVEVFADDVIRKEYVEPALDKLNAGIDLIVFKAKGQAINVAVRAALLLEAVMGVMQKHVTISSEPARPPRDRPDKDGGRDRDRLVSSMEISMRRF